MRPLCYSCRNYGGSGVTVPLSHEDTDPPRFFYECALPRKQRVLLKAARGEYAPCASYEQKSENDA